MDRVIKWIIEHKKLTIILLIAVIILPVLIVHILYKFKSNCYWLVTEWNPGELLLYFGNVLTFIGTVVLGYVAVIQTERANQMNRELLKIEKNKIKPCLEISAPQQYKIYLGNDMTKKLEEIRQKDVMIMTMLYTHKPRTGYETSIALMELEVFNSGFSDVRKIYVKSATGYLVVADPNDPNNEKIAVMGNCGIKINEKKCLYIHISREISCDEENDYMWYEKNTRKLMPRMEFVLEMETVTGNLYTENISFGSGWDISMKDVNSTVTRNIGVVQVKVEEASSI